MTEVDVRPADRESGSRSCLYCGEAFDPEGTGRLYCSLKHQKKAADRRRHGNDPRQPPLRTLTCPWCGVEFTTRMGNQVFCSADHRRQAMICERKRGFLTLEAARAVAGRTAGPVEPYRCPRADGRAHWHLRSVRAAASAVAS